MKSAFSVCVFSGSQRPLQNMNLENALYFDSPLKAKAKIYNSSSLMLLYFPSNSSVIKKAKGDVSTINCMAPLQSSHHPNYIIMTS